MRLYKNSAQKFFIKSIFEQTVQDLTHYGTPNFYYHFRWDFCKIKISSKVGISHSLLLSHGDQILQNF